MNEPKQEAQHNKSPQERRDAEKEDIKRMALYTFKLIFNKRFKVEISGGYEYNEAY